MKYFLALALSLLAIPVFGAEETPGTLIITNLATAPFPHPDRTNGHYYKTNFLSYEKHYQDNTVYIFVPPQFKAGKTTDFIVHFHGWGGILKDVVPQYRLREQLIESKRNAILVVPQGPYDSQDSFDGKLEDADGFKRFMTDVVATLKKNHVIKSEKIGKIVLSGHSGGYQVMSSIVEKGGLSDHVKEVYLFDALYARTEKFSAWFDKYPDAKIVNIYTENGGTKKESELHMDDLKKRSIPFVAKNEADIVPTDLKSNRLVFIYTPLRHIEVVAKNNTFREFLKASCLQETQ